MIRVRTCMVTMRIRRTVDYLFSRDVHVLLFFQAMLLVGMWPGNNRWRDDSAAKGNWSAYRIELK